MSDDSEPLTAALTYAARGWPVAPAWSILPDGTCACRDRKCPSPGKHPIGKLVHSGVKGATTDESVIRAWWAAEPSANVLIRTGMVGERCLVAIDIDPRHNGNESLAELIARHGELPPTPQCCTGGGGQHIFLWSPTVVPNSVGRLHDGRFGEGVDIRGEGGYVIAAPSRHVSGRSYEWETSAHPADVDLAEAPQWVIALAGQPKKLRAESVEDGSGYMSGGRNNALTSLAGAMRRVGTPQNIIEATLLQTNDQECLPPLDPVEVRKIAWSVAHYEPGDPTRKDSDPWAMMGIGAMAAPIEDIQWVVEQLGIAPGAVTIFGGAGYSGKTLLLQMLMLSIASGESLWGEFAVGKGVCRHFDFEQGPRLTRERYQRGARGLGFELGDLPDGVLGLYSLPDGRLDDKGAEDTLVRLLEGVDVSVMDAYRGAFPTAQENDSGSRSHLDMLMRVSERTRCAIITIAHSRKIGEDDDPRSSLRGSGALFDAAQTVYMLDGAPGRPIHVHNTKDRLLGIDRETFGLRIEDVAHDGDPRWGLRASYVSSADIRAAEITGDDWQSDMADNIARLSALGNRIMLIVRASPGITREVITSTGPGSPKDISAALNELTRTGMLRAEGKGKLEAYFTDDPR